jgi:uncharacterized membrane protein YphA (DoxX/SURF4 family)
MERMDRARRTGGLSWVGAGVVFQLCWALFHGVVPGAVAILIGAAVVALAVAVWVDAATARTAGGWLVAVLLAADLGGAVADRFGALGSPGAPGVSWGDWSHFVDYTRLLLGGVAGPAATAAAVGATVVECLLALALLTGCQRRWTGKAAAGLLTVYLVAMTATRGLDEVAAYAVPVLIGGALLVSTCPPRRPARAQDEAVPASTPTARGGGR